MIAERLKKYIELKELSFNKIETTIGCSHGMLSRSFSKKTDFGCSWLEKIAENYPDLNFDWVITGQGEMLRQNDKRIHVQKKITDTDELNKTINFQAETINRLSETINRQSEIIARLVK